MEGLQIEQPKAYRIVTGLTTVWAEKCRWEPYANTLDGAQASAVIYSLIETAQEDDLDPNRYLLWVLQAAPQLSETDKAWPVKMSPANTPEECYMPHK